MTQVAVIGAGIAGLTAAFRLRQLGLEVVIFEAADRAGGVIRSERAEGFLIEHGPNSIQSAGDVLEGLMDELDLAAERVLPTEAARTRYIVREGRPVAAPASPGQILTTDLFRAGSKLRVLREPFVSPGDPDTEESVAAFVRRRLGHEILDYGMEPFVAGIYAGDVDRLSIRHAFPGLYDLEQTSGSILKGQIDRKRDGAAAAATHRMFSFPEGLQRLPAALGFRLGERLRLSRKVTRVSLEDGGWIVQAPDRKGPFEAVIMTAPLHALADLDVPTGVDLTPLLEVVYAPLCVVALGFRREHVRHPLDGFGMLVPRVERSFRILGTLFTSSIFPGRAPDAHVLFTTFVGGMRHPSLTEAAPSELYEMVRRDLHQLLGLTGDPVLRRHIVLERAIPQYELGYGRALATMEAMETTWPGWFLAGNFRQGVSVGDTAGSGDAAARRCASYLGA